MIRSLKAYAVSVIGRVQRVGYRRYVLEVAQELGVSGFVKNEEDGTVSIHIQGEEGVLETFLDKIKNPPPPAIIREVRITPTTPKRGLKIFKIRYGRLADELQEGLGAMQTIFTSYWDEFRDFRTEFRDFKTEFRDFRSEFRDFRTEFRDYRGEFKDFREEFRDFRKEFREFRDLSIKLSQETIEEVRGMRQDLRALLDERLARLERDIAEIKARLGFVSSS